MSKRPTADRPGRPFVLAELSRRGLRLTRQRKVVLDALRACQGHPDAHEIYQRARRRLPSISLGTVYRALGTLGAAGLVRELRIGKARGRFEEERGRHDHVICTRCQRIEDLPSSSFHDLARRARRLSEFMVTEHRLEFFGLCPACAEGAPRVELRPLV